MENKNHDKNTCPHRTLLGSDEFNLPSDYLVHVRTQRGLSMSDLLRNHSAIEGVPTSLSLSVLSKLEAGKITNPRFRTMVAVAAAYDVPLADLARFYRPDAQPE